MRIGLDCQFARAKRNEPYRRHLGCERKSANGIGHWAHRSRDVLLNSPHSPGNASKILSPSTEELLDVKSGQVRAKIVKTAPGNAEKLAP